MGLRYEWKKAIEQMRVEGYAVVVFNPDELGNVHPNDAEHIMRVAMDQRLQVEDEHTDAE